MKYAFFFYYVRLLNSTGKKNNANSNPLKLPISLYKHEMAALKHRSSYFRLGHLIAALKSLT